MAKPYSQLTEMERWEWHADYYAFRRVVLGVAIEEKTTPADTEGKWYNEGLIRQAAERLRVKYAGRRRRIDPSEEMRREGVAMLNKWARSMGFADFSAAEHAGHDHNDAIQWVIKNAVAEAQLKNPPIWRSTAADMGVKAREYTSEEMRMGRIALGLESDQPGTF